MRKITKSLLALTLLFGAVGGAKATKLYATYGTPADKGSWNAETGVYSWTGSYSNLMDFFVFGAGELANYESLHFTTSDYADGPYRVCFMTGSTATATIDFYSAGEKNLVLSKRDETKDLDLSQITSIKFGGASSAGSIKIMDKPYLMKPMSLKWGDDGTAEIDITDLTASGCFSLNDETGVLTSSYDAETSNWGRLTINIPAGGIDLSALTGFKVTSTGDELFGGFEINGGNNKAFYSNPQGRNDLATYMTVSDVGDPSAVTLWRWWNNTTVGTMTISSIKLKANVVTASNPHETLLTSAMFVGGCENHIGEAVGQGTTIYGNGSVLADQYVDLSAYDQMRIYGTPNKNIRLLFNWTSGNQREITGDDIKLNSEGYYSLDLTTLPAQQLNAFKFPWDGQTGTITRVVLYKASVPVDYSYVFSGSGSMTSSTIDALADASATSYDATGVTGTGVDLTGAANPNALFIANEGVLANASNVIVSSACAQLALTDGYPFKAPAAFTATAAPTYDRAFTASTTTTVCLPFALTATEAATLGTFYELSSIDGTTLHFTSVDAPEANKAYLVVPTATSLMLSETDKAIAATPADLGTTVSGVDFIGTLTATTIPASDGSYSYYAFNNGSLVRVVENAATLPAFRGYFRVAGASARSLNISLDDETTGIGSVKSGEVIVKSFYNLKGQRVSQPTKGLYIVNGKKVVK